MKAKHDVVTMSSKGQVVVPKQIREAVGADAGAEFVVYGSGNTIVFRLVEPPSFSAKELEQMVAESERKLKKAGFVDANSVNKLVSEAVAAARRS